MIAEKVKVALRLRNEAYDSEISGLISAALSDLRLAGIIFHAANEKGGAGEPPPEHEQDYDALIERAVILYVKAYFGFNNDSERFQKAYDYLKSSLILAEEYHGSCHKID